MCRRCYTRQHRERPESPRPLAVAERHIRASPPRKTVRAACSRGLPGCDFRPFVRFVAGAAARRLPERPPVSRCSRDRPSPFQSARTATAASTAPHSNRKPRSSPASVGARRSASEDGPGFRCVFDGRVRAATSVPTFAPLTRTPLGAPRPPSHALLARATASASRPLQRLGLSVHTEQCCQRHWPFQFISANG